MSLSGKAWRLLTGWGGYVLCAAGFALTVAAFYPGLMSDDSFDQWDQGHRWWFYDVHPPLMSAVWGLLDRVVEGPGLMLLLHNLLFWGGATMFWRATRARAPLASLAFAGFGLLPQVWATLPTIWKDVGLGASLLLASALVYAAARKEGRGAKFSGALLLASVPLLFYGYGVRLNAAPAVLPLALWSGVIACRVLPAPRGPGRRRVLAVAVGLVYFALLTAAVSVTTRLLVKGNTVYPHQQIFLFDLTAISAVTGRPYYPEYLSRQETFSPAAAAGRFEPCGVNTLIYGHSAPMQISRDAVEVASLRDAWLRAVRENPAAYLRHRARVFACLTGIGRTAVVHSFLPATGKNNPPQFRRPLNALTRALTSYFFLFSNTPFFRGFIWLMVCAAAAYVSLRLGVSSEEARAAFVLSSSGLLYGLGYFFYTPSSEFRYLWWTVLAACVSAVLLATHASARRGRARPSADPRPASEAAAAGAAET